MLSGSSTENSAIGYIQVASNHSFLDTQTNEVTAYFCIHLIAHWLA